MRLSTLPGVNWVLKGYSKRNIRSFILRLTVSANNIKSHLAFRMDATCCMWGEQAHGSDVENVRVAGPAVSHRRRVVGVVKRVDKLIYTVILHDVSL